MTNKIKTREQVMKIKAMRAAGFTSKVIAETLGVRPRTVGYWVARMKTDGIDTPTTAKRGSKAIKL